MFDIRKTRMIGLPWDEEIIMLSRFYTIPERDGRTDRQNSYINVARQHARQC